MQRRSFLKGAASLPAMALISGSSGAQEAKPAPRLSAEDAAFLEELSRRSFQFFWDYGDPHTGITREHAYANGTPFPAERRDVGSTGATGFGITALCIGAEHGWVPRDQARQRALNTLRYYADHAPQEHGWFYHWLNVVSGERTGASFDTAALPVPKDRKLSRPKSEVSVSDSTWLVAGALTAGQCFREEPEMARLATALAPTTAWKPEPLAETLKAFAEAEGVGMGKFGPALRGVLSGGAPAPDLASALAALGREESLGRIEDALSQVQ